jgi:hypothetical protein
VRADCVKALTMTKDSGHGKRFDNPKVNDEFMRYLQVRLFGLVAFVDQANENEHFPMASGVLVETEVGLPC